MALCFVKWLANAILRVKFSQIGRAYAIYDSADTILTKHH